MRTDKPARGATPRRATKKENLKKERNYGRLVDVPPRRGTEGIGKEKNGSIEKDAGQHHMREIWSLHEAMRYLLDTNRIPLITDDGKFDFYRRQGLELIVNKK